MTNKILNLDDLAPAQKEVKLAGASYKVKEMTVEDFVKRQREARDVEAATDPAEQMRRAVDMVCESLPTVDRKLIDSLTLPQVTALINFVVTPPEDLTDTGLIKTPAQKQADAASKEGNASGNA